MSSRVSSVFLHAVWYGGTTTTTKLPGITRHRPKGGKTKTKNRPPGNPEISYQKQTLTIVISRI